MYLSEKIKRENKEFILRKLSSAPSPDWYNWIKLPEVWVSLVGSVDKVLGNKLFIVCSLLSPSPPTLLRPPEGREGIPGGPGLRDELQFGCQFAGGVVVASGSVRRGRGGAGC